MNKAEEQSDDITVLQAGEILENTIPDGEATLAMLLQDPEEDYNEAWAISEAMLQVGGSFVKHLGRALRAADPINRERIKTAFPEYWADYRKIAEGHNWYKMELDDDKIRADEPCTRYQQ